MTASFNLEIVRKLLNDAFNAGDVRTLAFDRFQPVYNDFATGMTKGQMIEAIVDYANRQNRIPDLLSYVKNANAYQYSRYADQLKPISQTTSQEQALLPSFQEQRLHDLKRHIREDTELLREYEEDLRYAGDARERRRIKREIERQKSSLTDYEQQLEELTAAAGLTAATPSAESETAATLNVIRGDLGALQRQIGGMEERLVVGQQTIRDDIARQQDAILGHIDESHCATVGVLLERMSEDQLALVEKMEEAAETNQIPEWQAQNLTATLEHALKTLHQELQQQRKRQPEAQQIQSLMTMLEQQTSWKQKVKLALPLIPGILTVESEMAVDVLDALDAAWKRLTERVTGKK